LELTQSQGSEIVGSLWSIELSSTGEVSTLMANVRGVVDGERLTLAISTPMSSPKQNYSGVLSDKGLDLNLSGNTGLVSKVHFTRDSVENFNAESQRLAQTGQVIKAEKLKGARVDALNRSASALEASLDAYVKRANKQINDTPRFVTYFIQASKEIGSKLQHAQRLATGNGQQRLQAKGLFVQIEGSSMTVILHQTVKVNVVGAAKQRRHPARASLRPSGPKWTTVSCNAGFGVGVLGTNTVQ